MNKIFKPKQVKRLAIEEHSLNLDIPMWGQVTFGKTNPKVFFTKIWNSLSRHITQARILRYVYVYS